MHAGRMICCGAAVMALLSGCGNNTLDKPEAQVAYAAYLARFADAATPRLARDSDQACAEGGAIRLHNPHIEPPHLILDHTLVACISQGVIMDGTIKAKHRGRSRGLLSVPSAATLTEKGDLAFRGAVEGTCEVDLKTEHTPATQSVQAKHGSFCGFSPANLVP